MITAKKKEEREGEKEETNKNNGITNEIQRYLYIKQIYYLRFKLK